MYFDWQSHTHTGGEEEPLTNSESTAGMNVGESIVVKFCVYSYSMARMCPLFACMCTHLFYVEYQVNSSHINNNNCGGSNWTQLGRNCTCEWMQASWAFTLFSLPLHSPPSFICTSSAFISKKYIYKKNTCILLFGHFLVSCNFRFLWRPDCWQERMARKLAGS